MHLRSKAYLRRRQRMMARLVTGDSLLDIGYAQDTNPYFPPGVHRVGLDLEAPRAPCAYEEQLIGDVRDMAAVLGDRRFSTVLCGELIEHLEQPYEFLRNLRSFIEPGGRLILSTPNPLGFPVVLLEYLANRRFMYTSEHTYYFTPRWVIRLLERSGYRLITKLGVGLWLPGAFVPFPISTLSYQLIYVAATNADGERGLSGPS